MKSKVLPELKMFGTSSKTENKNYPMDENGETENQFRLGQEFKAYYLLVYKCFCHAFRLTERIFIFVFFHPHSGMVIGIPKIPC